MSIFFSEKDMTGYLWINRKLMEIIDKKKSEGVKRKDFLQLLLDAETDNSLIYNDQDSNELNLNYLKKK